MTEMLDHGRTPDVITYNKLVGACNRVGHTEEALQHFETMQSQSLNPNVITYTALITTYAKVGQAEHALQLFEAMQSHRLTPNVVTYSALISACGKGKQTARAFHLFESMQSQRLTHDVTTCTAVIVACAQGARAEQALRIFETMPSRDVTANVITYNALISACESIQLKVNATHLCAMMRRQGVTPNKITYDALTSSWESWVAQTPNACAIREQRWQALDLFRPVAVWPQSAAPRRRREAPPAETRQAESSTWGTLDNGFQTSCVYPRIHLFPVSRRFDDPLLLEEAQPVQPRIEMHAGAVLGRRRRVTGSASENDRSQGS